MLIVIELSDDLSEHELNSIDMIVCENLEELLYRIDLLALVLSRVLFTIIASYVCSYVFDLLIFTFKEYMTLIIQEG